MTLKKYTTVAMAVTMLASTVVPVSAASMDKLVGDNRYETAVMISKKGFANADTVVLVNDSAIADALAATPYAEANNAPILLTSKKALTTVTKDEILRLKAKKVVLIGGEAVLPTALESELKDAGVATVERIKGDTREETALEIAKKLNETKKVTDIAVVNGTTGLADAVSIAAAAAQKDMPIILSNPKKGIAASKDFITDNKIANSYIVGGESVVSEAVASELPGATRIEGSNRNDTNAKVIEEFYNSKELSNIYVAKNGSKNQGQLIDALSVGVLAAKNNAPVVIVGSKLTNNQKTLFKNKIVKVITQVGGNGNEDAINEIKATQTTINYEVNNKDDLNTVLANANAGDTITIKTPAATSEEYNISTEKALNIKLEGTFTGKVVVDAENANIEVSDKSIKELEIKKAKTLNISEDKVQIENIVIASSADKLVMTNSGVVKHVEVNASGVSINNSGVITDKISGTATDYAFTGNKTEQEKSEEENKEEDKDKENLAK